jgi:hypothetical protein
VRGCLGFGGLPVTSEKVLGVFRIDKKKKGRSQQDQKLGKMNGLKAH